MFQRTVQFPTRQSFFLFGARATGKSTLVHQRFHAGSTRFIDLLLAENEDAYARNPDLLYREALQLPGEIDTIVVGEIQKAPRLLDVIHRLIFETRLRFVLTGSSARKLRHGAANLLAGRAFERTLHPLTAREIGNDFRLDDVLAWGALPQMLSLSGPDRRDYLVAYCRNYLKEEIWGEHLIRKLEPFRKFLEVAAHATDRPSTSALWVATWALTRRRSGSTSRFSRTRWLDSSLSPMRGRSESACRRLPSSTSSIWGWPAHWPTF